MDGLESVVEVVTVPQVGKAQVMVSVGVAETAGEEQMVVGLAVGEETWVLEGPQMDPLAEAAAERL